MSFLPPEYFWLEPVLIAAVVLFVVDLVSNAFTLENRVVNALVTAIIFGAIFGAVVYLQYGEVTTAAKFMPPQYVEYEPVLIAAVVVFIVDLISNYITLGNKFVNALVTALIFGAIFAALVGLGYGDMTLAVPTPA